MLTEEQGGSEQLILQPPPPPPPSLGKTTPTGSSSETRSSKVVELPCIQKIILEYFEPKPPEAAGIPSVDQHQLHSQEDDEYFASRMEHI